MASQSIGTKDGHGNEVRWRVVWTQGILNHLSVCYLTSGAHSSGCWHTLRSFLSFHVRLKSCWVLLRLQGWAMPELDREPAQSRLPAHHIKFPKMPAECRPEVFVRGNLVGRQVRRLPALFPVVDAVPPRGMTLAPSCQNLYQLPTETCDGQNQRLIFGRTAKNRTVSLDLPKCRSFARQGFWAELRLRSGCPILSDTRA
jgi:hypothetical protein